ncbi:MAG: DUF2309 domain-containing protein [Cyclobacteriaceae bacterium]|nr:DUF2309 domain-containing protein [Cyclobacteriaceae bacterium]
MKVQNSTFAVGEVIHNLKHFLPAQAPLKDFIHHNTLHAFQDLYFFDGLRKASEIFGYKVSLTLNEYRDRFAKGEIRNDILEKRIEEKKGAENILMWKEILLTKEFKDLPLPRIGSLRANWKKLYRIDLDSLVHPLLFRILCSYLDQGISMWNFPVSNKGLLGSIKEMERTSFSSFFRTKYAKNLLVQGNYNIESLLKVLVGDEQLYEQYLYDQQFAHQGWSGMVSTIEDQPQTLLDRKAITLHDLIVFELLLEIDALNSLFGEGKWLPLGNRVVDKPTPLFDEVIVTEYHEAISLWQESFEWSYYDEVLSGLQQVPATNGKYIEKTFQAMFCIDDRECSLRRHLESTDPNCETLSAPGFFGVEFFFQPEHGKFYTKLCPAPVTPKYLIKEFDTTTSREKDAHFAKYSHSLFRGWFITQTLGFWSAFKLLINIFKPSMGPAVSYSFRHMDKNSRLSIENIHPEDRENDLQIGFTIDEMVTRVEGLLKSIGLVKNFATLVYVMGHGSSSVNNPHYAAYDCGACSGRAGSVNSRVFCYMANLPLVREILRSRGIDIPDTTRFVGGLHDTTRDEVVFFDEASISESSSVNHKKNVQVFHTALDANAKERSRRFESINTRLTAHQIHDHILTRSVSLFEPRPELNHATNSLCIIGRRSLTKHVFLDRRAFLNSYDYRIDPDGKILFGVMKPVGPVCGGINLEYFFSRVDNQKLGAGTKLPHNVMGLFGVANGIDGDLRPGLPSQMIEVHDPVRLMVIVEHFPDVVLKVIQTAPDMYEWFINEWVHLVAINPDTKELSYFNRGTFVDYRTFKNNVKVISSLTPILEKHTENLPVYILQ